MVEVDFLPFLTTVSTLIAVAMASLFLCCWRRKSISDADGGVIIKGKKPRQEESKTNDAKADNKADDVTKPGTTTDGTPETDQKAVDNGSVSEKSSGFVDANDELGDFSIVQRETEILRSYRKPPPPKNRARQSRAPRGLTRSTENLDIFTELTEEDNVSWDTDNKENEEDLNEINKEKEIDKDNGEAVIRPKFAGKELRADTRSSMLADIEMTLAALHQQEKPNTESSQKALTQSSPNKDNLSPNEDEIKKDDVQKCLTEQTNESNRASTALSAASSQSKSNPDSPRSSPIPKPKPKPGPKVSPKPKQRKIMTQQESNAETNLSSENSNSNKVASTEEDQNKTSDSDNTPDKGETSVASAMPSNSIPTSNTEDSRADLFTSAATLNLQVSKEPEQSTVSKEDSKTEDISNQIAADNNTDSKTTDVSTADSPEKDNEQSSIDGAPEKAGDSNETPEDTVKESGEKEIQEEEYDNVTNNESVMKSSSDSAFSKDIDKEKIEQTLPQKEDPEEPAENSEESERTSREEEQQDKQGRVRRESSEGKGKVSRIPVRAGSKPRTSPPKTTDTGKS